MNTGRSGFTLIDAMVALVIFSLMASGFLYYTGKQAQETEYLADKTMAAIVAANVMAQMRSGEWSQGEVFTPSVSTAMLQTSRWPDAGKSVRSIAMAQKQWQAYVDIEDTHYANLRRIKINVSRVDTGNSVLLLTLTGFLGKH
jgi:Tfp pilus assembly protein PilV